MAKKDTAEKTYQKIEIEEIKTYKTSDGIIFDDRAKAEAHEMDLKDPEARTERRIKDLETQILDLIRQLEELKNKVNALEFAKTFPSRPHPDISPWSPYQQPYNPMVPTPKLPAEPGDVTWDSQERLVSLTSQSDEELMKKGYRVSYCGDKRCVLPPFDNPLDKSVNIDLDSIRGNTEALNGTQKDKSVFVSGEGYSQAEKDFREWFNKNKK